MRRHSDRTVLASAAKPFSRATPGRLALPRIASPRNSGVAVPLAAARLLASPVLAADEGACAEAIAAVNAALAKNPSAPALAGAKRALRVAERERAEGAFDACVGALDDAGRALK